MDKSHNPESDNPESNPVENETAELAAISLEGVAAAHPPEVPQTPDPVPPPPARRNPAALFFVAAAVAVMLFLGFHAARRAGAGGPPDSLDPAGKLAPDFTLASLDGKNVTLSDLRGQAVLLNFWATWCGPCKIEMPWLVDLQKKYGPEGLQIVGVAMDDTDNKEIADFAHKMGVNYVVLKGTEKVGDLYGGIEGLPTTYYLDRSGKVVDVTIGLASESVIEDAIKKSLAQGN
jgi:thiol-disulfide isomerase/thioredoxin